MLDVHRFELGAVNHVLVVHGVCGTLIDSTTYTSDLLDIKSLT